MINKNLTKQLFLFNNSLVLQLPDLNANGLFLLLKRKGFIKESKLFFKEGINGKEFISLMSNSNGLPILKEDFKFTEQEIQKLEELYYFIYKLRRIHYKKNFEKEIPYKLC
jgi:hypothetical protein